jgi:Chalcone isomerase-like
MLDTYRVVTLNRMPIMNTKITSFAKKYAFITGIALGLCALANSHVHAQTSNAPSRTAAASSPVAKVERFPKQIQVEGVKLSLNGFGTRYKAIFKVYDMGLYTTTKVNTLQEAISAPGPKKMQFIALRDISTTEIGQLFYRGIKENATPEQNLKHSMSALRMSEIASSKAKILSGETFSMEFVPGKGLTFFLMDKPQGQPIGDAEFFSMVLSIWLGSVPADFMLKDALLNVPKN